MIFLHHPGSFMAPNSEIFGFQFLISKELEKKNVKRT